MFKSLWMLPVCLVAGIALAQDATKVEPTHYKIAFENEAVQVVNIHYGPHEKSSMHTHPAGVIVYVSEGHFRFTDDKGNTTEAYAKAGDSRWFPTFKHTVENLSDKPFDGVYIGMKKAAPVKKD
ncbi:MAG TPA: cupin domain-containing protein [Terriglobales bacterium]|nr:cupin domain-containing protein [Terriglobales bacterium]